MNAWYKQDDALAAQIQNSSPLSHQTYIWYLGQCGFLFKNKDVTFAIDPVLNDLLDEYGQTKRLYPAGLSASRLKVDYVFCTHAHRDHMEAQTLKQLKAANPDVKILLPVQAANALQEKGMDKEDMIALKANQSIALNTLQVHTIRTVHPRRIKEGEDEFSLGYVIEAGDARLMHLGDTYLDEILLNDLKKYAKPDVLFAPVNGKDYFRDARGCIGNLNGYEAARLASEIEADLSIPCHYDMMRGNTCSPLEFIQQMLTLYPQGKIGLPRLGERMIIQKQD
jgi:L-ascorbate metabolism protein UlaG (beta-lactamase superfamily)